MSEPISPLSPRAETGMALFPGTGEMATRCRSLDWASTPLGPVEDWPQSFRASASLLLSSPLPMLLLLGPDLAQIYNDGFRAVMQERHPSGLGQPTRACWPEVWEANEPIYRRVQAGEAISVEDALHLPVGSDSHAGDRFSLFYSPVRDDAGQVAGVLVVMCDMTEHRRNEEALRTSEELQAFLLKLSDALRPLRDPMRVLEVAARMLGDQLGTHRVVYFETESGDYVVAHDSSTSVPSLPVRQPMASFGTRLLDQYRSGATLVETDVEAATALSAAEKAAFLNIHVRAYIGVPLVKEGEFVAGLAVHMSRPREWTGLEIHLVEETADRTWAAVERARMEEERDRERALFETVLDTLPVGLVVADSKGRITHHNAVARTMWGASLLAESWEDYDHFVGWYADTGQRIPADGWAMARALRSGEATHGELIRYQKFMSEEQGYYLNNVAPIRDDQGHVTGAVGAMLDVGERVAMEEALRESESRFRAVADLVPDLLWQADREGRRIWANPRWTEYTGQSHEEAAGRGLGDAIHPDDRYSMLEAFQQSLSTGRPFRHEHRIRGADGHYRWFLVQAIPVRGSDGVVAQWFGAATDVHEQRQARETLEEQVMERTREARELAATLTMAEHEERRRISQILHDDLQQLLYGIQMRLALAWEQAERGNDGVLLKQTKLSLDLLEDAITRTRQLTVELAPPVLEGEGLVDALRWLEAQMRALHGLEIEIRGKPGVDLAPKEMRVLLFLAVRELLFNVAKHAGTSRAVVDVGGDEAGLRIVVTDHGRGFDPEALDRVGGGSRGGFGLFNIRERLRLQGGRLEIHSGPGQGTRALIYAPVPGSPGHKDSLKVADT